MTSSQPDPFAPDENGRPHPWVRSLNIIVGAMAASLVVLGVVLVVLGAELAAPEPWLLGLVTLATVGAWGAVLAMRPTRQPGPASVAAVQTTVILRVALLEAPALLGLVLAFLADPLNLLLYVLPAVFSLAGIALFARPGVVIRQINRGV